MLRANMPVAKTFRFFCGVRQHPLRFVARGKVKCFFRVSLKYGLRGGREQSSSRRCPCYVRRLAPRTPVTSLRKRRTYAQCPFELNASESSAFCSTS